MIRLAFARGPRTRVVVVVADVAVVAARLCRAVDEERAAEVRRRRGVCSSGVVLQADVARVHLGPLGQLGGKPGDDLRHGPAPVHFHDAPPAKRHARGAAARGARLAAQAQAAAGFARDGRRDDPSRMLPRLLEDLEDELPLAVADLRVLAVGPVGRAPLLLGPLAQSGHAADSSERVFKFDAPPTPPPRRQAPLRRRFRALVRLGVEGVVDVAGVVACGVVFFATATRAA
mmetsp:Transcript_25945/g.89529  ORF Transcript_25945/g.89529 Transcript_25945/m.89529 type:complete len:231 (-) Transcript_25945:143-835(-)